MAIAMYEKWSSRGLSVDQNSRDITIEYIVTGATASTDYADVYTYVRVNTPTQRDGLYRAKISCEPRGGGGVWDASVDYSPRAYSETGLGDPSSGGGTDPSGGAQGPPTPTAIQALGPQYSFTTGNGTTHITQSIKTRAGAENGVKARNGNPRDNKKAIGVTKDGVEGTDIITPAPEFSVKVKRQNFNFAFYYILCQATGKTNNAAAFGGVFKVGELLYLGCEIAYTTDNIWELTHKFAYNENKVGLIVSDGIVAVDKLGWDYLWVQYSKVVTEGWTSLVVEQVNVDQVYYDTNFAALQCGA